jgi:hypothetical protein
MTTAPKNISLFIPRVFANIEAERITEIFERDIGKVRKVDIVKVEGKTTNRVFIHFESWYDTVRAHDFQASVLNPAENTRYIYDGQWYWLVLENKSVFANADDAVAVAPAIAEEPVADIESGLLYTDLPPLISIAAPAPKTFKDILLKNQKTEPAFYTPIPPMTEEIHTKLKNMSCDNNKITYFPLTPNQQPQAPPASPSTPPTPPPKTEELDEEDYRRMDDYFGGDDNYDDDLVSSNYAAQLEQERDFYAMELYKIQAAYLQLQTINQTAIANGYVIQPVVDFV